MLFKTQPYVHQLAAFERSSELESFALTMEQGTGKSKVVIDSVAHLYNLGRLTGLLIIAPNGVHRNWILKEIPKHLPDYVPYAASAWSSAASKKEQLAHDAMMMSPHLRIFAVNVEAMHVPRVVKEVRLFLNAAQAMTVIDESTRIKSPSGVRTKNILALTPLSRYRRILTGTPVTQSPLDVFSQYSFLDPDLFGTRSFTVFRSRYAEMMDVSHPLVQHIMRTQQLRYAPALIATDSLGHAIYKNLRELKSLTDPHTLRVLKKDCLDLPPKIYTRIPIEMHEAQAKAYADLKRRLKSGLIATDTAGRPLTKLNSIMYLQRILCGTLPGVMTEDGKDAQLLPPDKNPRVQALLADLAETDEQAIIWCRFTDDIRAVTDALAAAYGPAAVVQYFGETSKDDRVQAIDRFQDGSARFFVGNPQAGGTGLTLTAAGQVHYYSNSFKLEDRLQSEDRAHRIGQHKTVRYVDYEVEGTIDSKILQALHEKKNVADVITGDAFNEWLA